jgi:hypothetical protein
MERLVPMIAIVVGLICVLIGAFYTIGLLPGLMSAPARLMVDLIGLLALGVIPLGLGLASIWYGRRYLTQARQAARARRDAELEQTVLHAVRTHPQGITAREYASHTPFSVQEVEAKLEHLYLDGVLELEVTEQGRLVYKLKASP